MIIYLDTSALVPLMIAEPSTGRCARLWDEAGAKFSSRIAHVEASAALASAYRSHHIGADQHEAALVLLDELWQEISVVEIDETLMRAASSLARSDGLRGYDAVHCASALRLAQLDVVAVSGDRALGDAWHRHGLMIADVNV